MSVMHITEIRFWHHKPRRYAPRRVAAWPRLGLASARQRVALACHVRASGARCTISLGGAWRAAGLCWMAAPGGGCLVDVGRHGSTNPAGRVRERNDKGREIG